MKRLASSLSTGAVPRRTVVAWLAVLAVASVPILFRLGHWPLVDPDEGRNAEAAREMLMSGTWAVPQLNGLPFLDKPPLLFWSIAAAFRAFGFHEFAARLPSAISGIALVGITGALAAYLAGRRAAIWAAIVVATAPLVLVYSRIAIFDLPLTALFATALLCLVRRRLGGRAVVWLPLASAAMGLAVLTKGPVGVVLPLVCWLVARGALPRASRPVGKRVFALSFAVFGLVCVPWILQVLAERPDFLRYAIVDETLLRFTSTARFNRGEPVYYPLAVTAIGMGVWTAVLIGTANVLRRGTVLTARARAAVAFALRIAATVIVFFSLSASKRAGYVLPAFVPLAILVAIGITTVPARAAASIRVAAAIVLVVAAVAAAAANDPVGAARWGRGEVSDAVTPSFLAIVAVACFAWACLAFAAGRVSHMMTFAIAAAFGPALYLSAHAELFRYANDRSSRYLARLIAPGATVVGWRHYRPSLSFYLKRPFVVATDDGTELRSNYVSWRATDFIGSGTLRTPAAVRELIRSESPVYVFASEEWAPTGPRFLARGFELVAQHGRSALWVAP